MDFFLSIQQKLSIWVIYVTYVFAERIWCELPKYLGSFFVFFELLKKDITVLQSVFFGIPVLDHLHDAVDQQVEGITFERRPWAYKRLDLRYGKMSLFG